VFGVRLRGSVVNARPANEFAFEAQRQGVVGGVVCGVVWHNGPRIEPA
jgi:hypothetical protein